MEEKVSLQTYSVADLKEWLLHNHPSKGLSSAVISSARAYAIVNNPFVEDDMAVCCALFVNEKLVAYTAAFPEVLQRPMHHLAWWFSTLWCDPAYAGRGYGLIVVGALSEMMGEGRFFDADGARETVEIFKMLGLDTVYIPRYVFGGKNIHTNTLRGKLAWCVERIKQRVCGLKRKKVLKQIGNSRDYTINYSRFVDDDAYSFMMSHSGTDLLLRKQETFNWILQYPFVQCSPLRDRVSCDNVFSSIVEDYHSCLFQVFEKKTLIGVALLVYSHHTLSVKYVYYSNDSAETMFDALVEHALSINVAGFQTNDKHLAEYLSSLGLFTKYVVSSRSFSFPKDFEVAEGYSLQAGEGDMFV